MSGVFASLTLVAHLVLILGMVPAVGAIGWLVVDCWVGPSAQAARARRRAGGA